MTKNSSVTFMTTQTSTSISSCRTTVILAKRKLKQISIFLLITITLLSSNSFHTYCDQRLHSLSRISNFEKLKGEIVLDRTKRWTSELGAQQSNRQQQIIPAANPNFEAAFQGECGKNNNSNPCGHICLDLYDGTYECSCFYGFTLAVDGYSCTPIVHTTSKTTPSLSTSKQHRLQYKEEQLTQPPTATETITTTSPTTPSTTTKQTLLQAKALGPNASFVGTSASSDGSVISPVEEKTSDLIERSANDNRKLVDEPARGVKLRNIGRNGKITGIKASSDESEVLRRQRRLLGATAWSLQDGKKREGQKSLDKINYPPSFSIKHSSGVNYREQPQLYKETNLSAEKELTTNNVALQRPALEMAITGSSSSSSEASDNQNNKAKAKFSLITQIQPPRTTFPLDLPTKSNELDKSSLSRLYNQELKSMMLENDRLLDQLARSISESLDSYAQLTSPSPSPSHTNLSNSETKSNSKYNYEMSLLEELVGKTIQDYKPYSLASASTSTSASQASNWRLKYSPVGIPGKLLDETEFTSEDRINEASGKNRSSSASLLEQQQSIRLGRPDSAKEEEEEEEDDVRDEDENENRNENKEEDDEEKDEFVDPACSNRLMQSENSAGTLRSYRNCSEHPECESGGQCTEIHGLYARCRCPVGRGGNFCQKPVSSLNLPKFTGLSYLAVPMITEPELIVLRLVFKPEQMIKNDQNRYNSASRLLLYSQGKFSLLLDSMNRIELRYSSSRINEDADDYDETAEYNSLTSDNRNQVKVTRVFGSRDASENNWNELIVTSDASILTTTREKVVNPATSASVEEEKEEEEDADDIENRIVLVTPDRIQLKNHRKDENFTELFLGGLPDNNNNIDARTTASELESTTGFSGCIRELNINGRVYSFSSDFNGDTLDGFDIAECCSLKLTQ